MKKIKKTENLIIQKAIREIEKITSDEHIKNNSVYSDDLLKVIERLKDNSFRIAVVGEFSSGKSTFLNALIGQDILKHGAKETTATITEIENVADENHAGVFDVYYTDGRIATDIPYDMMQEYTSTESKEIHVAEEIVKVVVKSCIVDNFQNVSFIDTPGLNGIADNHREQTIKQIKNAHACIYLLQVRGLGNSDIEFIRYISNYQHNIIFVQNFIDELKALEGESAEYKVEEQRRILQEKVFYDIEDVEYAIVGLSARKALIARDYGITRYENYVLTEDMRKTLYQESRFDEVMEKISELMNRNAKESLQQKSAVMTAVGILEKILDILQFQNEQEREVWEESSEGKIYKGYEKVRLELENNKSKYKKNLRNFVDTEADLLRKQCNKKVEQDCEKLMTLLRNKLNNIENLEQFDAFRKKHEMERIVNQKVTIIETEIEKAIADGFDNLICNAVLRIKTYTGSEIKIQTNQSLLVSDVTAEVVKPDFLKEEDEIEKLEKELAGKKAALNIEKNKNKDLQNEIEKIQRIVEQKRADMSRREQLKQQEIQRMGKEPVPVQKYRQEPHTEYRGGTGFLDWLLGPKTVMKQVAYLDYNARNVWRNKKANIENAYNREKSQFDADIRTLTEKKNDYEMSIAYHKNAVPRQQSEIKRIQELLNVKIQSIQVKREMAEEEYLTNLKKNILEEVKDYLYEKENNIQECIQDNIEMVCSKSRKKAEKEVLSLYEISFSARINSLKEMAASGNITNAIEKSEKVIMKISNTVESLEELLCQI